MSLNKSKALRTAEKYVLQGKIPAAIEEYRKVVDADPSDLTTINTLGDLYVRAGRIQDAINNFSRIAESYRESGFTLKAIAMLKKMSKLDPTNIETAMKLANLYSQQGLLVEARQQYLQVADAYARGGQTRKALDAYQKIADLDPSNTSVRMKLGEIYMRERMEDQAHESFIFAGAEFLRKGDIEQALNANLKAITINPESRQGLTAIATIYTQQGQPDKAINILCDAFERNPGDIELLTILGRTYLSAGFMDDAERTFLSLVELDRNRYNYLLEVGRTFLQNGELDRAAEQIDGCLDILITKREEDKAIDFLRRILDRDMYHLGALRRLAQIFLRIREDHNLIATLNSLAEAALRKGDDQEAIAALKELARLEPDEPLHLQRLYNLGVTDIVSPDAPDVVRATGPLDFQAAAYDDTFVVRQISEAEILAGHGQVDHAVAMLQGILIHVPENVQVHLKLKDIYLRAARMDKAAKECLELARIHELRGESSRASDFVAEAHQLDPMLAPEPAVSAEQSDSGWASAPDTAFGFETGFALPAEMEPHAASPQEDAAARGFDFDIYKTGELIEPDGYNAFQQQTIVSSDYAATDQPQTNWDSFGYDNSSFNGQSVLESNEPPAPAGDFVSSNYEVGDYTNSDYASGGYASSDYASSGHASSGYAGSDYASQGGLSQESENALREELEGVDFYLAQGYFDIARDTLDRLRSEYGDHAEIASRYEQLGDGVGVGAVTERAPQESYAETASDMISSISANEVDFMIGGEIESTGFADNINLSLEKTPQGGEHQNATPLLIHKESGPLYPDLMVQLNTSDLANHPNQFDSSPLGTGPIPPAPPVRMGTADLIESIVSDIDASFDSFQESANGSHGDVFESDSRNVSFDTSPFDAPLPSIVEPPPSAVSEEIAKAVEKPEPPAAEIVKVVEKPEPPAPVEVVAAPVEVAAPIDPRIDLQDIFEEVKEESDSPNPLLDYETHYSLGLAYKDMDLLDEAIEQFQMAFKLATTEEHETNSMQCCHMLGFCFQRKGVHKLAVMWFERGLKIQNRSEDEYQALRYEIASCYEESGEIDKALDVFMEVYGIDVSYRQVGDKIKQLQSMKN